MKLLINFLIALFLMLIGSTVIAQEWQDFSMPDDTTTFHKICKVDDYYWAVDYGNGRIYHSQNQGKNWELQYETEGAYLEAIQFLDEQTGYVCGDYGIIMKTVDGGKNWKLTGPKYTPRITKANPMEEDTTALAVNYYQMYFKNKEQGLFWGFKRKPNLTSSRYFQFFYYQTNDGGNSWQRIDYDRKEKGATDRIVNTFLAGTNVEDAQAMGIYHLNNKAYQIGRNGMKISEEARQDWITYPFPQLPDRRRMLRTVEFVSSHQGYIFGGNLKDSSSAYILETLDGGKSWRNLPTQLPHIHYTIKNGQEILLAGKDGLLKKWTPKIKDSKSIIHKGETNRILIDGKIEKDEWIGANKTTINAGINLYTLQDDHYLYLSIQYDTTLYANYYADLYFELGKDTLLNIHASQQLGERLLIGSEWTDSNPAFNWGYLTGWSANSISFDRKNKKYIPYTTLEFQIAKNKLPTSQLKIALQTRDLNWEKEAISIPTNGNFTTTKDWLFFYWD